MELKCEFFRMGERSVLVKFDHEPNEKLLHKMLFIKNSIQKNSSKPIVDIINTYDSLLISYESTIENIDTVKIEVLELIKQLNIENISKGKIFEIPVCYEQEFGLDLSEIAEEKQLSINEIIRLHTAPKYLVYFTGFLPGFLYLGGLDQRLVFPRKKSPRKTIQKGSVAIGENQTGIYPKNSPGGWNIIGKTPLKIFDKNSSKPSVFSPGDKIKFKPISKEDFDKIQEMVDQNNYQINLL